LNQARNQISLQECHGGYLTYLKEPWTGEAPVQDNRTTNCRTYLPVACKNGVVYLKLGQCV